MDYKEGTVFTKFVLLIFFGLENVPYDILVHYYGRTIFIYRIIILYCSKITYLQRRPICEIDACVSVAEDSFTSTNPHHPLSKNILAAFKCGNNMTDVYKMHSSFIIIGTLRYALLNPTLLY